MIGKKAVVVGFYYEGRIVRIVNKCVGGETYIAQILGTDHRHLFHRNDLEIMEEPPRVDWHREGF